MDVAIDGLSDASSSHGVGAVDAALDAMSESSVGDGEAAEAALNDLSDERSASGEVERDRNPT